jgi:hypothetical protein
MADATVTVQSLKGMLRKPRSPVGIEEMNKAIAECGAGSKPPARDSDAKSASARKPRA